MFRRSDRSERARADEDPFLPQHADGSKEKNTADSVVRTHAADDAAHEHLDRADPLLDGHLPLPRGVAREAQAVPELLLLRETRGGSVSEGSTAAV